MEIIYYTIPSLVVLIGVYFLVSKLSDEGYEKLHLILRHSILKENQKLSLPIRFQAYERLTLLLDRMSPLKIIGRNKTGHSSAQEYSRLLIADINSEVQYNVSQQIYVSAEIWKLILSIKTQISTLILEVTHALPANASAEDLSNALIKYMNELEEDKNPVNVGLKYLRNEVAQLY
ncbi:MAG: hypothetical protein M9887_05230 [Chitinophagales bacterium]|nr:hypothetical protein [Chitinophagales bacterium]